MAMVPRAMIEGLKILWSMPIAWAWRSIISSQTAQAYGSFASTASEIVFMSMFSMLPAS